MPAHGMRATRNQSDRPRRATRESRPPGALEVPVSAVVEARRATGPRLANIERGGCHGGHACGPNVRVGHEPRRHETGHPEGNRAASGDARELVEVPLPLGEAEEARAERDAQGGRVGPCRATEAARLDAGETLHGALAAPTGRGRWSGKLDNGSGFRRGPSLCHADSVGTRLAGGQEPAANPVPTNGTILERLRGFDPGHDFFVCPPPVR